MLSRTRNVCTRCLLRSPSTSLSLPEAGLLRSVGLQVRSQSSTSRLTTTRTQVTTSPLVASNINNNIHRWNPTLTLCRGLSTSATSTASSKKKNPPPAKESVTKQPSSPPAPASKKTKTSNKKVSSTNSTQPPSSPSSSTAIEIPDYKYSKTKACQDLDRLQALVDQLVSTNVWVSKRDILAQHHEQAPLLAWIYDPQRQFYARPANIIKYAQRWAKQQDEALAAAKAAVVVGGSSTIDSGAAGSSSSPTEHPSEAKSKVVQSGQEFDTLSSLLEALSSRSIVGHASLDAILTFMDRYCGPDSESSFYALDNINSPDGSYSRTMATLLSTPRSKLLLKVLDKNLKAGCGIALIREAFPTLLPGFHVALGKHMPFESARELFEQKITPAEKSTKGKKSTKKNTTTLDPNTDDAEWLGSRKLDGVRCLVWIDRRTGNITTLSRNGKEFEGTGKIQDSFRSIMRMGQGDDDDRSRDEFFRQAFGIHDKGESALPEALILDGEMCVFMAEPIQEQPAGSSQSPSSPTSPVLVGLLDEDGLGREQFTKAITFVTRGAVENSLDADDDELSKDKPTTTKTDDSEEMSLEYDRPIYCIFDCLTDKEFKNRKGARQLLDRIGGVTRALMQSRGVHDSGVLVKVLSQIKVESFEQLQKMVTQGVERGWEGVVLRKNVGYEGKRSRNLLKFKEFQEAEFTVEGVTLGTMRLPLNGQFEERYGLTSVTVVHRGNRVRVGSGFTAEERIRFGKDPSLIVGKTITVKYFEESKTYSSSGGASSGGDGSGEEATVGNDRVYRSSSRVRSSSSLIDQSADDDSDRDDSKDKGDNGDAVWSLRFPIVKAIYGDGPREL
ncbi:hypothetical protein BGZ47_000537 [Haplosporangium gracile]|nr:hypothetical protein BGZ47_000537 [Haplosporangium gracile]